MKPDTVKLRIISLLPNRATVLKDKIGNVDIYGSLKTMEGWGWVGKTKDQEGQYVWTAHKTNVTKDDIAFQLQRAHKGPRKHKKNGHAKLPTEWPVPNKTPVMMDSPDVQQEIRIGGAVPPIDKLRELLVECLKAVDQMADFQQNLTQLRNALDSVTRPQ